MQTVGFLGPAFFLSQLGGVTSATGAVLCMVASQGLDAFSQAGLYANHQVMKGRVGGTQRLEGRVEQSAEWRVNV